MISDPEMKLRRERLTDRDLVDGLRIGGPSGDDPWTVHLPAEVRVHRRDLREVPAPVEAEECAASHTDPNTPGTCLGSSIFASLNGSDGSDGSD